MAERLSISQIALLLFYAGGMAAGQLLFKSAALRYAAREGDLSERFLALFQDLHFLAALALYAALSILWVWVLSFTALSRAYPFVALAFALTPVLAALTFGETLSVKLFFGLFLILCGLFFVIV